MNANAGMNPFLPSWEYIPDGEPHVFGDRVYLYGSHDRYNGCVFCERDYVCWSAPANDLTSWSYEGVIYQRTDDPDNRDGSMCLFAPDVVRGFDGRYYLYYVLDHESVVAVAVCDRPAGAYQYYGRVHYPDGTLLGEREGDEPQFDPAVLRDGERLWLATGFCGEGDQSRHGAMLTGLGPDMLTVVREPVIIAPGCEYAAGTDYVEHPFFEGPSLRKINGRYVLIYSSLAMHELCYAISDCPAGPYRYTGVLISNCDLHVNSYKAPDKPVAYGGNNHGSILSVNGEYYVFYHRHTNGHWYSRQACAEKLKLRPDGTFEQAEISSFGLRGGALPAKGRYPAYNACYLFTPDGKCLSGEPRQPRMVQNGGDECREDGYIVDIKDGTTIGFHSFVFSGTHALSICTRGYGSGTFTIHTELNGPTLGEIRVDYSNVWKEHCASVDLPDGIHRLFLKYHAPAPDDPSHASLQMRSVTFDSPFLCSCGTPFDVMQVAHGEDDRKQRG